MLTESELNEIRKPYMLEGESTSSGRNGLFPGNKYYEYYNWGKHTIYSIPKEYETEMFGKNESDFAAYLEMFEYYDEKIVKYDIDLWRF